MSKTAQGLADYAKAQLGLPYWYGTFGQTSSEALYKNKKNQYPKYYTATDFSKQYGKRVHDCSGLIKGYLMSVSPTATPVYNATFDKSADGFYNDCTEKGDISTLPEIVGVIVWKKDHIGVYIGDGWVIEARGHAYGVIRSHISEVNWSKWGKLKYIDYSNANPVVNPVASSDETTTVKIRVLKQGMKGEDVKTLQILLNAKNNAGLSVDGSFGNGTAKAVDNYQQKHRLTPYDKVVGNGTWTSLIN